MKIKVRATQYNLLENSFTLLAEGEASLDGDLLIYRELADPSVRNEITFTDGSVTLKRIADIRSTTILLPDERGAATVRSPYGDMVLETELIGSRKDEERWETEYRIFSGDQIVTHQRFVWELSHFSD